jgi:uncharacterized protein
MSVWVFKIVSLQTSFMKSWIFSIASLFCSIVSGQPVKKQNKEQAVPPSSLLWQITGNGLQKPSYLFGTFHIMCKQDIVLSANLDTALRQSDELYFELDLDDPSMMLGAMNMMSMKKGVKLKDLYTAEDYARVIGFFKDSVKMPEAFIQNMKPYLLIGILYPKMMPCKTTSGVEMEVMALAKKYKKEIKGLETLQFQAAVFDSVPYQKQANELLEAIGKMNEQRKEFNEMVTAYKSQQLSNIEALFSKADMGLAGYEDVLLYNRNVNWVAQLHTLMKDKSLFVAVGAGHLPGKQGVIALLQQQGYTVTPVNNF